MTKFTELSTKAGMDGGYSEIKFSHRSRLRDVFEWGRHRLVTYPGIAVFDLQPSAGQPRTPSANLTRFAPDRRHWVLYETAQENDFLSWWLETEYGQQLTKNGQYNFRWSTESRSSKVWRHFDQVAEVGSGRPKVVCRSCLAPLNHPHHPHHKSHGTSTMGKHLKSTSCRRSKEKVAVSAVTSGPIQIHYVDLGRVAQDRSHRCSFSSQPGFPGRTNDPNGVFFHTPQFYTLQ
ncbi:uncharacterized protein N7511_003505 [Penicillium nucicola]|uniref:uncharacterized protein n=1 Tax=Penicillium nucicola TaxID=1850975 RepID=UPI00254598C4|nr:uncharacterized protein N7511_003505 [Penicillium nucicola]KAJ5771454.1 hypothetical protein N7511_003505 [Penicillium nucicola]